MATAESNRYCEFIDCLLSHNELDGLKVGDKFDHRYFEGCFGSAQILKKDGPNLYIHYIGFDSKWDVWCNYKQNPFEFARFQSVSKRKASKLQDNIQKKDDKIKMLKQEIDTLVLYLL